MLRGFFLFREMLASEDFYGAFFWGSFFFVGL